MLVLSFRFRGARFWGAGSVIPGLVLDSFIAHLGTAAPAPRNLALRNLNPEPTRTRDTGSEVQVPGCWFRDSGVGSEVRSSRASEPQHQHLGTLRPGT